MSDMAGRRTQQRSGAGAAPPKAGGSGRRPAVSRSVPPATRQRDADATRARILEAARAEFARLGLGGARVDEIAERARANKRMIYHYFRDKDDLFRAVLEEAYADIRTAERALDLDALPPDEALRRLITFTWNYYLEKPEFVALVNSANLHKARHLETSERFQALHAGFPDLMARILERGEAAGLFRPGIDPIQLTITVAAIGYYYLTNRYTGSLIYGRDLAAKEALDERLAFNIDTVLRIVRRDGA